jgi:hypothetical protein
LAPLSRFILLERNRYKKVKQKQIKELYGISTNKNIDYYHLNASKEYESDDLVFLINNYSISSFVDYLKKKTILFNNLVATSVVNIKDLIRQVDSTLILDYLLSEYIKIFPNIFVVLIINEVSEPKSRLTDDLKQNLFFKKDFEFPGLVIKSILFNIFQEKVYQERLYQLAMYNDYTNYRVRLLFYQTIYPINLSGSGSGSGSGSSDNEKIFIFDDINSKIRLSSIFFNSNTLSRYSENKIQPIKDNKIEKNELKSLLNYQSIKKWLYNIYSGNELSNVIIIKYKPLTILDSNKYTKKQAEKILNKKIDLFELVVKPSKKYNENSKIYGDIIKNINNPETYWEYEGIKVLIK